MIYYRCSRCRTRNGFNKPLNNYVRQKTCKQCGHNKFYFDKERNKRIAGCCCQGYWFPHRHGSKFCERNPFVDFEIAKRDGISGNDLIAIHFNCVINLCDQPHR